MDQEQVTTENTEEKAAEVITQSETAEQTQEPVRPKGKWFGRGIYGSKDVPIRILDGLIGVLIVVIVGMIIFFAVRGGFNIVYDTDGGSEVAARKVRYGEFLTEPETPYKPGYTFDGWYTEKEGETALWYFQSEKVTGGEHNTKGEFQKLGGGAISIKTGSLVLQSTRFKNNSVTSTDSNDAYGYGGAVLVEQSDASLLLKDANGAAMDIASYINKYMSGNTTEKADAGKNIYCNGGTINGTVYTKAWE